MMVLAKNIENESPLLGLLIVFVDKLFIWFSG